METIFYLLCMILLLVPIIPLVIILRIIHTLTLEQLNGEEMDECINQSKSQQLKELRQELIRVSKILILVMILTPVFVLFMR